MIRLLTIVFAVCMGLALLEAAAKLAVLLAIIAALVTFATRPWETIGCLGGLLLLGLIAQFPISAMFLIAILAITKWLSRGSQ